MARYDSMGLGQTIRKAVTSLVPRSRKNEPKDSLAGKSSSPDEHGRREQDESTNAIPNPKESVSEGVFTAAISEAILLQWRSLW